MNFQAAIKGKSTKRDRKEELSEHWRREMDRLLNQNQPSTPPSGGFMAAPAVTTHRHGGTR